MHYASQEIECSAPWAHNLRNTNWNGTCQQLKDKLALREWEFCLFSLGPFFSTIFSLPHCIYKQNISEKISRTCFFCLRVNEEYQRKERLISRALQRECSVDEDCDSDSKERLSSNIWGTILRRSYNERRYLSELRFYTDYNEGSDKILPKEALLKHCEILIIGVNK